MSKLVRKVDGFGVRRNATDAEVANFDDMQKFIAVYAYADDGMTDSSYTITKGDLLCFEHNAGAGYQITYNGTTTSVASLMGNNMAFCRITDPDGTNTGGNQTGATGDKDDVAFAFGLAAETVTIQKDSYQLISVQVAGIFGDTSNATGSGAKTLSSVVKGDLLFCNSITGGTANQGELASQDSFVAAATTGDRELELEHVAVARALCDYGKDFDESAVTSKTNTIVYLLIACNL